MTPHVWQGASTKRSDLLCAAQVVIVHVWVTLCALGKDLSGAFLDAFLDGVGQWQREPEGRAVAYFALDIY
jgi:hypothetical protein